MSMLAIEDKDYSDGMTKQSFKDQCDINNILKKAQRTGSLAHVQKYPTAVYAEFDGVDLLGAFERAERAKQIFADLPSEVRSEFDQDPFAFVKFAADPENIGRLAELLPAIAEPGRYFPNPAARGGSGAGEATHRAADTLPEDKAANAASAPAGAAEEAAGGTPAE